MSVVSKKRKNEAELEPVAKRMQTRSMTKKIELEKMVGQWDIRGVIALNYKYIVKYLSFDDIMALVRALFLYQYPCLYNKLKLQGVKQTSFFFNYPEHFSYLNLHIDGVRFRKSCLPLYEHLKILRFWNCSMYGDLPIKQFNNLQVLELNDCNMKCISTQFVKCAWNLKVLNLCHNKIGRIENLHLLKQLKHLDMSDNRISRIENLEELLNLVTINFSKNSIRKIENLSTLPNLEYLDLSQNKITTLENASYFPKLSYLNLNCNKIRAIRRLKPKPYINTI